MASAATLDHLPNVVIDCIARYCTPDGGNDRTVLGRGNLGGLGFVNRHLHEVQLRATVVVPPRLLQSGQLSENELWKMTPPLKVGQLLVWRDLDEAYRCVQRYQHDLDFWRGVRAIFLMFVEVRGQATPTHSNGPRTYHFKKAHWVFLWLSDVIRDLTRREGGHHLEWLWMEMRDSGAIMSMDGAGLFGLARMPNVTSVRFVPPVGRPISSYVKREVRAHIRQCTSRVSVHEWSPEGTETAWMRTPWREMAERRRRARESDAELWERWMKSRLALMNRL